jgi:hypothetical protein
MPKPTPPFDPLTLQEPEGKRSCLLDAVCKCVLLLFCWMAGWPAGSQFVFLALVLVVAVVAVAVHWAMLAAQCRPHCTPSALQLRRPYRRWTMLAQWSPARLKAAPTGAGAGKPAAAAVNRLLTPAALSTAKLCRCLAPGVGGWRPACGGGRAMEDEAEPGGRRMRPGVPACLPQACAGMSPPCPSAGGAQPNQAPPVNPWP